MERHCWQNRQFRSYGSFGLSKSYHRSFLYRHYTTSDFRSRLKSSELCSEITKACRSIVYRDRSFCSTAVPFFRHKPISRQICFYATYTDSEEQCPKSKHNWTISVPDRREDPIERRILFIHQQVPRFITAIRDSIPPYIFRSIHYIYENLLFCTKFSYYNVMKEMATKVYKIWNRDKTEGRMLTANKLDELFLKVKTKFHLTDEDIRLVLLDGCMIDDEDAFQCLRNETEMFVLKTSETLPANNTSQPSTSDVSSSEIAGLIENLRKKVNSTSKRKAGTSLFTANESKKIKSENVKVSPGWQHFCFKTNRYHQVRSSKQKCLPTGDLILNSQSNYAETLKSLENLYFKNGKSIKGKLDSMQRSLGNSKAEVIKTEGFSAKGFVEHCNTQKPRLYLLTKKKIPDLFDLSDSSDMDLPDPLHYSPQSDESVIHIKEREMQPIPPTRHSNQVLPSLSLPEPTATVTQYTSNTTGYTIPTSPQPSSSQTQGVFVHAATPTVLMALPDRKCSICTERECDAFFMPCGHTACLVCGLQIDGMGQNCPNCRCPIESVKSMFYN